MTNTTLEKWEEKTINDVCIVERGSSPRPIKNFITSDDSGVNWIKIGDCSGKYVTNTAQKITIEGAKKSIYDEPWAEFDEKLAKQSSITLIVQVNGKIKDKIEAPQGLENSELEKLAKESAKVKEAINGKNVVKTIVVPNKLVNIVIK